MRIRSLDELNRFLDQDLAWRKKELTTLNFMVGRSRRNHERVILLRAAICILYAHWEGFIKNAATSYICFVVSQGLRLRDLAPNFLVLGLLSSIRQIEQSRITVIRARLTESLSYQLSERFSLDCEAVINTRSNLNSEVFKEICQIVGIESVDYDSKNNILDERLLGNRNRVSHGIYLEIESNDYASLHEAVVELIDRFRTDVENAAILSKYRNSDTLPL